MRSIDRWRAGLLPRRLVAGALAGGQLKTGPSSIAEIRPPNSKCVKFFTANIALNVGTVAFYLLVAKLL